MRTTYNNILSENVYLLDENTQNILYQGVSVQLGGLSMSKNVKGRYIVLARLVTLKSNSKVIIYNYIFYPEIYCNALIYFLMERQDFKNSLLFSEFGDFITIYNSNKVISDRLYLNNDRNQFIQEYIESNDLYASEIEFRSYNSLFTFINTLVYLSDEDITAKLVDFAVKKEYKDFVKTIFNEEKSYNILNRNIKTDTKDLGLDNSLNILNGCVFVVEDLDIFKSKVQEKGYIINAGPQKWRGQVNSMNSFLTCLDIDFRDSMYRHHEHHVYNGGLKTEFKLHKSNFSYRNVHQNLTGVRWYSTRTSKISDSSVSTSSSTSSTSTSSLTNKSIRENSPIYGYLYNWLKKSPINEDTQESLERYLMDYTYIGIDTQDKNPLIDYSLFSKGLAKLLLKKKVDLISILNNFRKSSFDVKKGKKLNQKETSRYFLSMLLQEVKNEAIISIMYGRLMIIITRYNRVYSNEGVLDIFQDISENIIMDYTYTLYNKQIDRLCLEKNIDIKDKKLRQEILQSYTLSNWKADNVDIVNTFKNITLKSSIGGIIIDWMTECDLIQVKVVTLAKNKKSSGLLPTDLVIKSLGSKIQQIGHLPFRLPMLVKPKPYSRSKINGVITENLGGYLLNDIKTTDSIILDNWELKKVSTFKDSNVVYDMVNNISSVGYKINKDLLYFIDLYGIEYNLIIHERHPLENSTEKLLKKSQKIDLESYLNKKELQDNIIGLARVYSQVSEFFIPVRLDFRARMYCVSEYLNYQSNELAKSLLLFSKGEKINKTDIKAINYLKAFGANCYGNKLDKKSWNDRAMWIDANIDEIINFHNGNLISKAKNKLLFIAFCIEYNRFLKSYDNVNTSYFETNLPIQLDATCNGYQHLSLLSLDLSLAKELNLTTSTWFDVPKDFYNFLSINLIDYFRNKILDVTLSSEDVEDYLRLSNISLQRTIIKKAVMTIPYNVSVIQMIKYIREHFELCPNKMQKSNGDFKEAWYWLKDDHNIVLKHKDLTKIALGLQEVLSTNFFKLKLLMKYLKNIAKICARLGLMIPWGSPSGVLINQSYISTDEIKLRPFSYSKNKFTLRVPNKEVLNSNKQIRAFMPNLIHSLDAASLALLTDLYYKNSTSNGKNIYAVHDCFAVTANNVENVMELLKLVYIKIYSNGTYLKEFDREIKHQIMFHYKDSFDESNLTLYIPEISSDKISFPDIQEVLGANLPVIPFNTDELYDTSYIIN